MSRGREAGTPRPLPARCPVLSGKMAPEPVHAAQGVAGTAAQGRPARPDPDHRFFKKLPQIPKRLRIFRQRRVIFRIFEILTFKYLRCLLERETGIAPSLVTQQPARPALPAPREPEYPGAFAGTRANPRVTGHVFPSQKRVPYPGRPGDRP